MGFISYHYATHECYISEEALSPQFAFLNSLIIDLGKGAKFRLTFSGPFIMYYNKIWHIRLQAAFLMVYVGMFFKNKPIHTFPVIQYAFSFGSFSEQE